VIQFVERKEINDRKWDECIQHSFNGNLYGYSWFLDSVAPEWNALIEDDYERVFPVVFRKRFGISYIYQPFFTQQLGLYSRKQLSSDILHQFIRSIPGHFRMGEINLNTHNQADEKSFKIIPQFNHELDLIKNYEDLRSKYSDNLARNLKKADKAGLNISRNIKPDDIIDIFRRNRGKDIAHLKESDYSRLKRMTYTCIHKGIADIWGVYNLQNQLCAGAFFFTINKKTIFLFSGLSSEGKECGAMPYLIDSFIREHAGKPVTFDFDGSNDPNLARFYKSFGARELIYQRLYFNRWPWMLKPAYQFVKWGRSLFGI